MRVLGPPATSALLAIVASTALIVVGSEANAPAAGGTSDLGDFPVRAAPSDAGQFRHDAAQAPAAPNDALLQDLQTLADSEGRDLETLKASHAGITEFSVFATELESSATFVRAGLSSDGSGYWIDFTQRPDAALTERIRALPVDVAVNYGSPASAQEIADLADSLTRVIASSPLAIREAEASYDRDSQTLVLTYTPTTSATQPLVDAILASALEAGRLATGELPLPVKVVEDDRPPSELEVSVSGGADLNRDSDNTDPQCTAGFTALRDNRGVLTAAHCINSLRLGIAPNAIAATPVEPDYTAIDIQFHRTLTENGHTTDKQFRATGRTADDERTVYTVANAPLGSLVCHWGRTSGYSCSEVAEQDVCKTYNSGKRYCGLDITTRDVSSGGDSGGPWFTGTTARGIHSGAASGFHSNFTRISRTSFVDATVLQN